MTTAIFIYFKDKISLLLCFGISNSCILIICSVNILVVWITLPHSGHGFFKYFYTKLVDHKYHIPKFSYKWTNSMTCEVFSSPNQVIDLKVTFLRFDNNYVFFDRKNPFDWRYMKIWIWLHKKFDPIVECFFLSSLS